MLNRLSWISVNLTVATLIVTLPYPLKAFTIELDDQSNITAIKDLIIQDKIYHVSFLESTFNDLFGNLPNLTNQPTFWQDQTGAIAARNVIDQVLENHYPTVLVKDYKDYLIPNQNSLLFTYLDSDGNVILNDAIFGAVWGNYSNYYGQRKYEEFLQEVLNSGGLCVCTTNVSINPETYSGTEVNATRLFANFTFVETVSPTENLQSTPEPSNLVGLIELIGLWTLSLIWKKNSSGK